MEEEHLWESLVILGKAWMVRRVRVMLADQLSKDVRIQCEYQAHILSKMILAVSRRFAKLGTQKSTSSPPLTYIQLHQLRQRLELKRLEKNYISRLLMRDFERVSIRNDHISCLRTQNPGTLKLKSVNTLKI